MTIEPLYEILLSGSFDPRMIDAVFDPSLKIPFSSRERMEIEKTWVATGKSGENLYNGPLLRLLSFREHEGRLFLELGLTDFKEYIGTNERLSGNDTIGNEGYLANPLAISVVTKTCDGQILIETRSKKVIFETKGKLHVKPSGHLTSTNVSVLEKHNSSVRYPIEDAVAIEAYEELGLTKSEILGMICTGLVRTLRNKKPELTFAMETSVDSQEVLARPKGHSWESDKLFAIPYEPTRIRRLLLDEMWNFVPPGHAAILLAGSKDFGNEWQTSLVVDLKESVFRR